MSEHNPRPLAELIDPGWARALTPVEGRIHELGTMLAAEVEAGHCLRARTFSAPSHTRSTR